MTSSPSKDTFPLMATNVKLCQLCGLWGDIAYRSHVWRAVLFSFCLIFWYLVPSFMFMISEEPSFIVLMKPILELFAITMFVLRISNHVLCRETLYECYRDLQQAYDQFAGNLHEDVGSIVRHVRRSAELLTKIYFSMVYFQAATYGVVPAITTIVRYSFGNEAVELPSTVLEADFVVFDHKANFWTWLPTMMTSIAVQYGMLTFMSSNECLFWNMLHHVSCLYKIVYQEIGRLNEYKNPDEFKRQLAIIVEVHEVCFRTSRRLESVLSPAMALLYFSCIFQTCYVMLVVSVIDDLFLLASMAFILQYTVFLIFSFSMLGTELMDASSLISEAIYNTKWYEWAAPERRLLLFMLMRSDRVVAISAAKFFHLNRATFGVAMKTAFSYFTLMQRFIGEDRDQGH
ncbi:AAEL010428-PA [Aedes aegypti]|nr:AAEL010428-PA [Aedes aegypti]DAA80373.1 TPA_exp: odorant receptor 26 [Aedes aegypti]